MTVTVNLSALEHIQGLQCITSGISDVCRECGLAPHSIEHLLNSVQLSKLSYATHSVPIGQPGRGRRLLNLDN